MQTNEPKSNPLIDSKSTTVFPHQKKGMGPITLVEGASLSTTCLNTLFSAFFRNTWTRASSHSTHYRHVNHFHHGHRHSSYNNVLYPEGKAGWPRWVERKRKNCSFTLKAFLFYGVHFPSVYVYLLSMLFWQSCESRGGPNHQTGRQERCPWWDTLHKYPYEWKADTVFTSFNVFPLS